MATYTYNGKKSFAGEFFDSLAAFYRKRWLLRYFVRRQVTRSYKRSYLGLAWAILGPLIWVFFLTIIFSEVVGLRFRTVEAIQHSTSACSCTAVCSLSWPTPKR